MGRHPKKITFTLMSEEKNNITSTTTPIEIIDKNIDHIVQQITTHKKTKMERQIELIGNLKLVIHNTQG